MMLSVMAGPGIQSADASEGLHSVPLSRKPLIEVASFGAAPVSGIADEDAPRPRPGDLIYRSAAEASAGGVPNEIETRVAFGESWPDLFRRVADRLNSEVPASPAVADRIALLPSLEAGKYVRLRSMADAQAVEIEYLVREDEAYSIVLNAAGVQVRRHASDPRLVEKMRSDPSKASLFTATDAIGLPEDIVLQLVEIFSDDVDFHRELHHGYRSTIVYEVLYREGHIERSGRILAAEFVIRNRRLEAYHFDDGRGQSGYFTEAGKSMKKIFRRSPVEFSRITSGFTLARFHPVLGLWRAHRGIDYAAPAGSRVMATADGVVDFMGDRGELGNLVILRHYDRFLTYYGHLNAFADGLAVGSKVEKGAVVGYVGMTGLTTGPHVHYEFRVDDGSGNGLYVPVPPPEVLEAPPVTSAAFFDAVRTYRYQLQVAQKAHFVILE